MPRLTRTDRLVLFERGFRHGAGAQYLQDPEQPDYMAGFEAGTQARLQAVNGFMIREGMEGGR